MKITIIFLKMQEFFDSNQGYGKYFQIGLKIRFLKAKSGKK